MSSEQVPGATDRDEQKATGNWKLETGDSRQGRADALLKEIQKEEGKPGRLKIFLGYSPGVGKTYSMLEEAHLLKRRGDDVVVGVVETHKRAETAELLKDLELIPCKSTDYKGITLGEFDLDAVLARKPSGVLVDELAHSNAPGSRHPKRYQDVEELLAAGIDVYTTINVQHFESQNDIIAKITGIRMQETVPDDLLDRADEVQVVDIPLEELFERLREGKVYIPEQAKQAMSGFFQRGNLVALREITLSVAARKMDSELLNYMRAKAINSTWPAAGRLMVCIGPTPTASQLVRKAYRIAKDTNAEWFAVYVSTPSATELSAQQKTWLADAFNLAEEFGAHATTLSGFDVVPGLLRFASENNVSSILIGKPRRSLLEALLNRSPIYRLMRAQTDFDLYLLAPTVEEKASSSSVPRPPSPVPRPALNVRGYLMTLPVLALATGLNLLLEHYVNPVALYSVYLVAVILVALRLGTGPSVLASVLSLLAYDFLFTEPRLTFVIVHPGDMLGALVFFLASIVVGQLIKVTQRQFTALQLRAERISQLEEMSRELLALPPLEQLISGFTGQSADVWDSVSVLRTTVLDDVGQTTVRHLAKAVSDPVLVLFKTRESGLKVWARSEPELTLTSEETAVAEWTLLHGEPAGAGTETLASVGFFFIPMKIREQTLGVIGVRGDFGSLLPEQRHLIGAIANLASLSVARWVSA
jgi:two-component system, OmpR family, sensor histidine kinase KdpD